MIVIVIKSHILKVLIYSLCCAVCVLGFGCQKVLQEPVFYLLGERHGVPSQQLEISQWLAELSETDSKTVVVMEMISDRSHGMIPLCFWALCLMGALVGIHFKR